MQNTYSITDAAAYLGVSAGTLRRWEREGRISAMDRTPGNHRRYSQSSLDAMRGHTPANGRKTIAYARVSGSDQKQDLHRQADRLRDFCAAKGWTCEVIEDLGSGLNYKKQGLRHLLKAIQAGEVAHLVITHKDRLLRFGAELVFEICEHHGTEVVVLEDAERLGFEEELARDVIELVTVFAARLYGARSHKAAKAAQAIAETLKP